MKSIGTSDSYQNGNLKIMIYFAKFLGSDIIHHTIRVSPNMMVVAIPESIVQQLHIDEQRTWFEEICTETGIFLKISSKEIG
ncbi:MAG: hypothetical protein WBZ36_05060 [Candidatus Nitrosopolaris sp.]